MSLQGFEEDVGYVEGSQSSKAMRPTKLLCSTNEINWMILGLQLHNIALYQNDSATTIPSRDRSPRPLNPLAPMLKALVRAAETALETDIRSAMVSAHSLHELGIGYLLMQSAFAEMDTDKWYRVELVVAQLMAALSLEGPCDDPDDPDEDFSPPQHILAV